ncbi:MAG: hypothetical protein ACI9G1_001175 [Pirellulaceae bacterium]|jgi:hypothetical protein
MSNTKSTFFYAVLTVIVLLALMLAFLVFIFFFGGVSGVEFSPDSFERRSFHYYQIPFLQAQVRGISREPLNRAFGQDLVTRKKIKNNNVNKERWLLVRQSNSNYHADVQILLDFLDASDDSGQEYWRQWTIDNDKLSNVVWPLVAQTVRDDLYTAVPDIFELIHEDADPNELKKAIETKLSERYTQAAQHQMSLQEFQRGGDLLTRAISYDANNEEAKVRKEECVQKLGN